MASAAHEAATMPVALGDFSSDMGRDAPHVVGIAGCSRDLGLRVLLLLEHLPCELESMSKHFGEFAIGHRVAKQIAECLQVSVGGLGEHGLQREAARRARREPVGLIRVLNLDLTRGRRQHLRRRSWI